jgi:hypothetical protein
MRAAEVGNAVAVGEAYPRAASFDDFKADREQQGFDPRPGQRAGCRLGEDGGKRLAVRVCSWVT